MAATAKELAVSRSLTVAMRTTIRNTEALWPMIATRVPSDGESENYGWLNDVPNMKEFLGERIFEELRASNYSLKNKTWEQSVGLDRHKIEDDQYGFYTPVAQNVAAKGARHPDKLLAELIVDGQNQLCYDGQNFYDTDHLEGESGTQSNLLTKAIVDATAPTVQEFADAFHDAFVKMFTYKTDQGDFWIEPEAVGLEENALKLLVPVELMRVAQEAISIVYGDGGKSFFMMARPQVLPMVRMSAVAGGSATKFDLIYTGGVIRPFIFQDRSPMVVQTKGADDIESKFIKIMSERRHNCGYGLWQFAVRTLLTTA